VNNMGCDDSTPVRGASYEPVAPLRAWSVCRLDWELA
jgi:hypothetical protein